MRGYGYLVTPDLRAPEHADETLFTSLRLWQAIRDEDFEEVKSEFELTHRVAEAIAPAEAFAEFRRDYEEWIQEELPKQLAADATELGDEFERPEPFVDYVTIVEGVTPLVDVGELDAISAAYDRVVDRIAELVPAYRIASKIAAAPVTRERLPPTAYFLTRNFSKPYKWSHGLLLAHPNAPGPSLDPVGPEAVAHFNAHLQAAQLRHPVVAVSERVADAIYALNRLGDTANAVIFAQLASEILLDTTLTAILLDEGKDAETAANMVSLPLAKKVKSELPPRLGGSWDLTRGGIVGEWKDKLWAIRGRVIHGGYVPTRDEARAALQAASALEDFVHDRVAARRNEYPRAALIIVGVEGLQNRGVWSGQIVRNAEKFGPDLLDRYADWSNELEMLLLNGGR
jgi:hypothetical protein